MGLTYNGTEVQGVTYNGAELQQITYNGTEIWAAQQPIGIVLAEKGGGSGIWGTLEGDTVSYRPIQVPAGNININQTKDYPEYYAGSASYNITSGKRLGKTGYVQVQPYSGVGVRYKQRTSSTSEYTGSTDYTDLGVPDASHVYVNMDVEVIKPDGTKVARIYHCLRQKATNIGTGGEASSSVKTVLAMGQNNDLGFYTIKLSWDFVNNTLSHWDNKNNTTEVVALNTDWVPGMYVNVSISCNSRIISGNPYNKRVYSYVPTRIQVYSQ